MLKNQLFSLPSSGASRRKTMLLWAMFAFVCASLVTYFYVQIQSLRQEQARAAKVLDQLDIQKRREMVLGRLQKISISQKDDQEQSNNRFTKLDLDGDGRLVFVEFTADDLRRLQDFKPTDEEVTQAKNTMKKAFALYDGNKDGMVTRQEFEGYHLRRFKEIDQDQDGMLSGLEIMRDQELQRDKLSPAKK